MPPQPPLSGYSCGHTQGVGLLCLTVSVVQFVCGQGLRLVALLLAFLFFLMSVDLMWPNGCSLLSIAPMLCCLAPLGDRCPLSTLQHVILTGASYCSQPTAPSAAFLPLLCSAGVQHVSLGGCVPA